VSDTQPAPTVDVPEATPDSVAALLRARTKDSNGQELGHWTQDTRPTLEQVEEQLDMARTLTELDVGVIPDTCRKGAEAVIAFHAALLIEKSYWPEQVQSERSAYQQLSDEYERYRQALVACVQGNQPGAAGPEGWRVYDVCTPARPCGAGDWPFDWWQRNLDQVP